MSTYKPAVGQHIRWTSKKGTIIDGIITQTLGMDVYFENEIEVNLKEGTVELLASPEPPTVGAVVRDSKGELWGRAAIDITGASWINLSRAPGTVWGSWDEIPQPAEVLFTPKRP